MPHGTIEDAALPLGARALAGGVAVVFFITCVLALQPAVAQDASTGPVARIPTDTATVGAQLSVEHVQGMDPWVMLSGHRTFVPSWGVTVTRLTVGERFGAIGVQGEAEAYPRLGRSGYLYAAAAASPNDEVFVPFRAALELFTSPGGAFELSAGARLFRVATESIVAYTGSVGGYHGNYWASLRPYVVNRDGSVSVTGQLSLRRYWAGRYDYVGFELSAGRGADPAASDSARLQRSTQLTTYSARVERLHPVRDGRLRIGYGLSAESAEVAPGRRRSHLAFTFRVERLLR